MSNLPSAAQITSPVPPLVRSLSEESSDHNHVSTTSPTLPKAIKPVGFAFSPKVKNPPSSTSASATSGEQLLQLSERESIFATHYLPTDSTATTPSVKPIQRSNYDLLQDGETNLDFPESLPSPASQSSLLPYKTRSSSSITSLASELPYSPSDVLSKYSSNPSADLQASSTYTNEGSQKHPGPPRLGHSLSSSKHVPTLSRYLRTKSQGSLIHLRMSEAWSPPVGNTLTNPDTNEDVSGTRQDRPSTERRKRSSSRDNVEKRIEATLANEEPVSNPRSRKASHYFRLFKENTDSQEQKKGRDKSKEVPNKSNDKELSRDRSHVGEGMDVKRIEAHGDSLLEKPKTQAKDAGIDISEPRIEQAEQSQTQRIAPSGVKTSRAPSDVTYRSQLGGLGLPRSTSSDDVSVEWRSSTSSKHALPLRLLEEIRNHPKPRLVSSDKDEALSERASREVAVLSQTDVEPEKRIGATFKGPNQDHDEDKAKDIDLEGEDYESEKEQISSATYFPHQGLSLDSSDAFLDQSDDFEEALNIDKESQLYPAHLDTVLEESHELIDEVTIALKSEDKSQCFHGDLPQLGGSVVSEEVIKAIDPTISSASESEYESWDDSTRSGRGDESGVTDDGQITPTATSNREGSMFRLNKRNAAPLRAVELKPYKHQVGGHSTVFRFSKRAVCKQLSNRENEFYEVIERRHPELLRFLPRYACPFYFILMLKHTTNISAELY